MSNERKTAIVPADADAERIGRRQVLEKLAWAAGASPLILAFGCGSDDDESGALGGSGGTGGSGEASGGSGGAAVAGPGDVAGVDESGTSVGDLQNPNLMQSPPWDDVPACAVSNTDAAGQGPFFVHDGESADDISLVRQDIRGRYDEAAEPGTELELHVRILDASQVACDAAPVAGIEVYIWHTDAQGYYSGFGDPGDQRPDEPYAGVPNQDDLKNPDRFCRGVQVTDANGVVSFRSIFPGWYNGRDIHVHVVALRAGSLARGREIYEGGDHLFTTQFYFDPTLSDRVHRASEPYLRRTALPAYEGAILADEGGNSGLRAKATFDGTKVVAQIQIQISIAPS
jgi:protocatechuate 3,4-dioxygenase beta subunit